MSMYTSNLASAWLPEDFGQMLDTEVQAKAIATQVSTVVTTAAHSMAFPVWTTDPAVGWVAEGADIPETDGETDELIVTPAKVAGLVRASNESLAGTSPAVADMVARGLVRQISESVDNAFFGAGVSNGPTGLAGTSGISTVEADLLEATNLDAFADAIAVADTAGATASAIVVHPGVAKHLATVKEATGSARNLLESTADGIRIHGVPMFTSRNVAPGDAWVLDGSQVFVVFRQGITVKADGSAAFSSDSTLIRAVARVGFGFVNPAGVVRIAAPAGS